MINSSATLTIDGQPVGPAIPLNWEPCDVGAYCWIPVPDFHARKDGRLQLWIMDQRDVFILQFKLLQEVKKYEHVTIDIQLTIPFEGPVQAIVQDRSLEEERRAEDSSPCE